jgi:TLD
MKSIPIIFRSSKCVTNDEQKEFFQFIGDEDMETELLYSGSLHGFTCEDFHSRADNKGPTISLFKMKSGDIIGGFTTA